MDNQYMQTIRDLAAQAGSWQRPGKAILAALLLGGSLSLSTAMAAMDSADESSMGEDGGSRVGISAFGEGGA